MLSAQDIVKQYIKDHDVMVFSKTYCPYCTRAKAILNEIVTQLGVSSKIFILELDVEANGAELQKALEELTGQRTVPNVFIRGQHIGGCDNTIQLQKDVERQKELFGI
ncbi:putative GRX1-glutaredoxin [Syncephalis fuscata]|nr:putative GRX1-glutaredoxin [Syncephalis fuscata]